MKGTQVLVARPQSQLLQRLRPEDLKAYTLGSKIEASLGYLTRPFLKIKRMLVIQFSSQTLS